MLLHIKTLQNYRLYVFIKVSIDKFLLLNSFICELFRFMVLNGNMIGRKCQNLQKRMVVLEITSHLESSRLDFFHQCLCGQFSLCRNSINILRNMFPAFVHSKPKLAKNAICEGFFLQSSSISFRTLDWISSTKASLDSFIFSDDGSKFIH